MFEKCSILHPLIVKGWLVRRQDTPRHVFRSRRIPKYGYINPPLYVDGLACLMKTSVGQSVLPKEEWVMNHYKYSRNISSLPTSNQFQTPTFHHHRCTVLSAHDSMFTSSDSPSPPLFLPISAFTPLCPPIRKYMIQQDRPKASVKMTYERIPRVQLTDNQQDQYGQISRGRGVWYRLAR
jgi:hypothetical protein